MKATYYCNHTEGASVGLALIFIQLKVKLNVEAKTVDLSSCTGVYCFRGI